MNRKRIREALLQLALQPRQLAKSLSQLLPETASHGLTVLSLDGQWLKLLQLEGAVGARRITKLLVCPVEGAGAEEILKAFQEACATEGVVPREVLIANPTHLCTIRLFSLPSTDSKEIRDIVSLQAEKHTPYAKEEILTDFKVLDRDRSGYSKVLLVIAHQDVVHRSVRVVETSGFPLDRVGCELEGLVNWFQLVKKKAGPPASADGVVIIEVDGSTTTVLVMQRGQLQFHRSLATGAEQLAEDPAQSGQRLVGELQRSLEAVEAEGMTGKIQEVILTGRIERLGELKTLMEQGLDVPVHLVSPWTGSELSEAARQASERLPEVSFASLVGLALSPSQLDLTPEATKLRHAFEARAKALVTLGCQVVAALVLVSVLMVGRAQKQQRYYEALRSLYRQTTQEAATVEEGLRQLEFVQERLRHRGELLEAVSTLARFSAEGIKWDSLTFTEGEGLLLKGTSVELPKVYEFVAGLDGDPLFGQVEAKCVSKRKAGEQDVADFEITCPLASAKVLP